MVERRRQLWRHVGLIVGLAILLFPLIWTLFSSLESSSHAASFPGSLIPQFHYQNYVHAWEAAPWGRYFFNTILIATLTTALVLITSLGAAYAFGMHEFPGKRVLFWLVLSVLMIPTELNIIPQYLLFADLHWLNTYQVQIIPWAASTFGIFLIRQFVMSLPRDLFDAARIDGAGELAILWHVVAPLVIPALVTVGVYVFLGSYNAFLWPLIVTNGHAVRPIEVGLASFRTANNSEYTQLSAAAVFTTLPVLVFFLIAQRYIVESISRTGVRG